VVVLFWTFEWVCIQLFLNWTFYSHRNNIRHYLQYNTFAFCKLNLRFSSAAGISPEDLRHWTETSPESWWDVTSQELMNDVLLTSIRIIVIGCFILRMDKLSIFCVKSVVFACLKLYFCRTLPRNICRCWCFWSISFISCWTKNSLIAIV